MKKVYLFSLSLFATAVLSAQTNIELESINQKLSTPFILNENHPQEITDDRAAGDTIWFNGFENAADWTAVGTTSDFTIDGWSLGSVRNSSLLTAWQSGNMGTTGNFARMRVVELADLSNAMNISSGPFTLTCNTVINLTGVPAPQLEFEQSGARYHVKQSVEISIDNGVSWTEVYNNDSKDPYLGNNPAALYGEPETIRVNISSVISTNPANVMVRLFWDGTEVNYGNGPVMNYLDFGWYVDNMRITEGFPYDSDIQNAYFRSGVGTSSAEGLEYYLVPQSQITPIEFSAKTINQGGALHTGLVLTTTVSGAGTYTGTSNSFDLAPITEDSVATTTVFTPSALGTYNIDWSFAGTNPEGDITNDNISKSFEVTEYTYGRDNGIETGSLSNFASNTGNEFSIGNVMDIFGNGVIGALEIKISSSSANVGKTMYGVIYKLNSAQDGYDWVAQTPDYEIKNSDVDGFVRVVFENPITVVNGDNILIAAGHFGDDVSFSYAQPALDDQIFGFSSGTLTGLLNPPVIMVRADMRDFTTVEELTASNITVSQNVPNPFTNNSVITYNLNESANVSVQIIDVTGKVVATINEGTQAAGEHNITIDGSTLAEGTYFYTFTAGTYQVTKRMVVSK